MHVCTVVIKYSRAQYVRWGVECLVSIIVHSFFRPTFVLAYLLSESKASHFSSNKLEAANEKVMIEKQGAWYIFSHV